jgi:hypothetical protein
MRVGVGLQDILALDADAAIAAVEHVLDAQPRLVVEIMMPADKVGCVTRKPRPRDLRHGAAFIVR